MGSDQCFQIAGLVVQVISAIVLTITAVVLAITLIVFYCNLRAVQKQILLSEILNQPLCGVKEVTVKSSVHPEAMEVDVTIVNAGNEVAKKASISYETVAIDRKVNSKEIITSSSSKGENTITILPKSEIKNIILYIRKDDLAKMVIGYDKFIEFKVTIEYLNMKEEKIKYTSSYKITRLLSGELDNYEANIIESSIEPDYIFSSKIKQTTDLKQGKN
jgi:hypothetical protein